MIFRAKSKDEEEKISWEKENPMSYLYCSSQVIVRIRKSLEQRKNGVSPQKHETKKILAE